MNFIKAQNLPIFANFLAENTAPNTGEHFFLATEASLSTDLSLEPDKTFGQPRLSSNYNVAGSQSAKMSFSYYPLIGSNSNTDVPNQWPLHLTGDFLSGHSILFGNYLLKQCYLSSLGVQISPQSPVVFKVGFDCFDLSSITGQTFTGANISNILTSNGSGAYLESIHALAMGVSGSGVSLPQSKSEISISTTCSRTPVYGLGAVYPSTVILESVQRQTSVRGEGVGEICSFSGNNGVLNLSFSPFSHFITGGTGFAPNNSLFKIGITGRVSSQSLDASPEGGLNGNMVIQENIH